jgi:hypothetical protein
VTVSKIDTAAPSCSMSVDNAGNWHQVNGYQCQDQIHKVEYMDLSYQEVDLYNRTSSDLQHITQQHIQQT